MAAFITAGDAFVTNFPTKGCSLFSFSFWLTDRQIDRVTTNSKTDTFPQPVDEVINWDSDPRQQSLLLAL